MVFSKNDLLTLEIMLLRCIKDAGQDKWESRRGKMLYYCKRHPYLCSGAGTRRSLTSLPIQTIL